ncbi:unnamed protein product [Calicophoron daubneyi]|uniref:THIF-type NAD/FAD binding fold domain-containing protein n=1 Tax=Calicophoron daubneyi TaxID=300641 RepID=A0AAV2TPB7_CALDB
MVLTTSSSAPAGSISEEEAALYDRQIRLWGIEAQNRLKSSRVLLLGIAKLTVADGETVSSDDIALNFLLPVDGVGKNRSKVVIQRVQALNPMVCVSAIPSKPEELPYETLLEYDVIILASGPPMEDLELWLKISRRLENLSTTEQKPQLICAATVAAFGFSFTDCSVHEFVVEDLAKNKRGHLNASNKVPKSTPGSVLTRKVVSYPSLVKGLELNWSSLNVQLLPKHVPKGFFLVQVLRRCMPTDLPLTVDHLQKVWKEVAKSLAVDEGLLVEDDLRCCCVPAVPAVNAILGGVVAQEIVRAITRKGAPHGNWSFIDGLRCSVTTEWLPGVESSA